MPLSLEDVDWYVFQFVEPQDFSDCDFEFRRSSVRKFGSIYLTVLIQPESMGGTIIDPQESIKSRVN